MVIITENNSLRKKDEEQDEKLLDNIQRQPTEIIQQKTKNRERINKLLKKFINCFRNNIYFYSTLIGLLSFLFLVYVFTYNVCDNNFNQQEKSLSLINNLIFELTADHNYVTYVLKNKEGYISNLNAPTDKPLFIFLNDPVTTAEIKDLKLKEELFSVRKDMNSMISELERSHETILAEKTDHFKEALGNVIKVAESLNRTIPILASSLEKYSGEIVAIPPYCIINPKRSNIKRESELFDVVTEGSLCLDYSNPRNIE